jgi:hypothetical protein
MWGEGRLATSQRDTLPTGCLTILVTQKLVFNFKYAGPHLRMHLVRASLHLDPPASRVAGGTRGTEGHGQRDYDIRT